ncbi:sterile alpha motif domain-containing protein 3-like isoform X3 [Nothobranchius furzeri]|uniref:sterile alpha motif domain-containing protein 3-like isoform X3 n=1 Tax=Nothobranchius furzeri TaxID=105023 RepID=UPI003904E17C
MAGRVTFRVIFGGEDDARKLTIESGIPNTVEEFSLQIKTFFQVTEPFRLQYRDREMDDQFMNLLSTSELEDKATVKVVYIPSETTSSNPLTRDASPTIPGIPSSSQEPNDSDSGSSNDTIILSSPETRSCSWPKHFVVPRFSYCAEMMLHTGNNEFNAHGTLLSPTPKTRSDILEGLAEEIMKYTAYPNNEQLEDVAKALIQSHPCLLEKGTRSGYCGWKHYLKIKMMNFRSKLSRAGHPEVAVNSLKNKRKGQEKPAANIKKPRKAEVNFCPNMPRGETRESMEAERVALLTEVKKKKRDEAEIKKKMHHTFSIRRQEVLQEPPIPEFQSRWPALFDVSEINLEFMRLTAIPLTSKFLGELDRQTDNLLKVFNSKGGAAGRKMAAIMAQMDNNEDINVRRDCVLSCLSIYLNEDLDTLVKEHVDIDSREAEADIAEKTMGIYTVRAEGHGPDGPGDGRFADVGVVLEGVEVLHSLQSVSHACVMLYGLIYALNLSYPKNLKRTFEVYQKILMDLDSTKLSPKVQALKLKLLE